MSGAARALAALAVLAPGALGALGAFGAFGARAEAQEAMPVGGECELSLVPGDTLHPRISVPGAGVLFVRVEGRDAAPRARLRALPHGSWKRLAAIPGASTVFLNIRGDGPALVEVEVVADAATSVRVCSSWAPDSEDASTALEVAREARAASAAARAAGEVGAANETLVEAAQVLESLPVATLESQTVHELRSIAEELHDAALLAAERSAREKLLAYRERHFPSGHLLTQEERQRLIRLLARLGDTRRGLELAADFEAAAPAGSDTELVRVTLGDKAQLLSIAGRNHEARALLEDLLRRQAAKPSKYPSFARSLRNTLAITAWHMGDLQTARAMFEQLLVDRRDVGILGNLSGVLAELGDPRASDLRREVRDALGNRPAGDVSRRASELNYATGLGRPDWPEAEAILERLATGGDSIALTARFHLAQHAAVAGDLDTAQRALEAVLAARLALQPRHPFVADTRLELARLLHRRGDHVALRGVLEELLDGYELLVIEMVGASRRARSELAGRVHGALPLLDELAAFTPGAESLQRRVFELAESFRAFAALSPRLPIDVELSPEIVRRRAAWRDASTAWLADVRDAAPEPTLLASLQALEESERRFRSSLLGEGWEANPLVSVEEVAASLAPDEAVVAYQVPRGRLVAHVILPGGEPERVELGSGAACRAAVRDWRAAIGRPLDDAADGEALLSEREAGEALRALVLDPVLERAPRARRVFVSLEDALHLVPLEALPARAAPGREFVGDEVRVVRLSSLVVRAARPVEAGAAASFLAVGGASFGPGARFAPVEGGLPTLRAVRDLFEAHFSGEAALLTGDQAREERVRSAAEGATHLLVHTHGFVDEDSRSWSAGTSSQLAPLAVSGLALAGANEGTGRGLLFAEELSTWDLRRCRLAVLSACETAAGIERAGQGVWSMQAALQAAGVEKTVTALWEVPRTWTERLLRELHSRSWADEPVPVEEALWQAKRELREERVRTKDWAGWVLGGSLLAR